MKHLEHDIQVAFFDWCRYRQALYPELAWIHAIPNGGQRDIRVAQRLKAEGVKPGVFDVFLPVARCGYHGLYIEFKAGKNKLTPAQEKFREHCRRNLYWECTCYSWQNATRIVERYLQGLYEMPDLK